MQIVLILIGEMDLLSKQQVILPHHIPMIKTDGGLFGIEMVAKNTGGAGAGHSFSASRTNYITVYTPDPSVSFAFL